MKRFNLSDWALHHRSFVWFLMAVSLLAGALAYVQIGREEDPDFAIKTMVISASLPGASVQETLDQVTDRIERKLEDLDELNKTRSITRPGQMEGKTIRVINTPLHTRLWSAYGATSTKHGTL